MSSFSEALHRFEGFAEAAMGNSTASSYIGQVFGTGATSIVTAAVVGVIFLIALFSPEKPTIPGAPVHGRHWWWEPTIWLQSRFTLGAYDIVASGYRKVRLNCRVTSWDEMANDRQYKDRPFIVKRFDINFNVLPNKYLEELRLVPETILDQSQVQVMLTEP